jgi:hypothetical protein
MLNSVSETLHAQLSDQAEISILTGSPGEQLYSTFGHSAIRVYDPVNEIDLAYNYGTFDFNTSHFYLKFARGKLKYTLSVETFEHFVISYIRHERTITEQPLILSPTEKNKLYQALLINAQPENREYQYDFFHDNCATRVRDIIANNISDTLQFTKPGNINNFTFRKAIALYLKESPWVKLGLNLILGEPTDDTVTEKSIQFLPDYLMTQFESAKRTSDNSSIVETTKTIYSANKLEIKPEITPLKTFIIICLFVLLISFYGFKKHKSTRWLDFILFSPSGLLGLLIIFLWFLTDHTATGPNWNILWANPLLIIFLFLKSYNNFFKCLACIIFVGQLICLLLFATFKQYLPLELIPIWFMFLIRIYLRFTEVRRLGIKNK